MHWLDQDDGPAAGEAEPEDIHDLLEDIQEVKEVR